MEGASPCNSIDMASEQLEVGDVDEEDIRALSAHITEPVEPASPKTPLDGNSIAVTATPSKDTRGSGSSTTPLTGAKSLKGSAVKQPTATAENILAAKDDNSISARISCANYCVMAAADLVRISRSKAARVTELLNVTVDDAFALLKEFKWDEVALQEAWFSEGRGEEWVRERCGVFKSKGPSSRPSDSSVVTCKVCYCDEPIMNCVVLEGCPIDHAVCRECFAQYIHTKLNDVGRGSPDSRCVMHKCGRRVPKSQFLRFLDSSEDRLKYIRFYYDFFFITANPATLWCPNPMGGCGRAVLKFPHPGDVHRGGRRGSSIAVESDTVVCDCGYCWCFACQREAHEPAACKQVYEWEVKNSNESENVSWILANTKQCPKCARPIEKNQGCNHMRCSEAGGGCGQEFCWLCLTPWAQHGQSTGGRDVRGSLALRLELRSIILGIQPYALYAESEASVFRFVALSDDFGQQSKKTWTVVLGCRLYSCNIYERNTREDTEEGRKQREGEKVREKAKHALQKYMFHYERFVNHDRAANMAREVIASGKIDEMKRILHDRDEIDISELGFVTSALQLVVECRRVLKWTYVYGYYLATDEGASDSDGGAGRDIRRKMSPPSSRVHRNHQSNHSTASSSSTHRSDINDTVARRQLFEFLQKNLEEKTEALHELIEKDLEERFIRSPEDSDPALTSAVDHQPPSSAQVGDAAMPDAHEGPAPASSPRRPNDEDLENFKNKFTDFRSYVTNYHHVTEKFLHQILTDIKDKSIIAL
ncbi:hypothetical protein FOL47_003978 [Perkinsus chesapeaki]|uniref:RBR-type E3 ubiquitin transferase n=1 Tax=Perkinsus chesapeaki TaxID=330153 RepID=A0A7J6N1N6_PERCH|nr:hypothetical protein FOL47_003978 [Perkinsus chesapeaki]